MAGSGGIQNRTELSIHRNRPEGVSVDKTQALAIRRPLSDRCTILHIGCGHPEAAYFGKSAAIQPADPYAPNVAFLSAQKRQQARQPGRREGLTPLSHG